MDLRGVALVTRGGTVRTELAGGLADVAAGRPCTLATRFQLCSISKQFAAVATLLLAEAGRLALDDPVDRWLPGGPPQWSGVTLHHLLSHTAGVPHWLEAPGLDPAVPTPPAERLQAIQAAPLRTAPGQAWHYSSPGFVLVGLIVEQASGQPYARFLTERILAPLDLTATSVGTTVGGPPAQPAVGAPPPEPAARGYRDGEPVTPFDLAAMTGTGDIWSTAPDLTRFTAALHTKSLLTNESLHAMLTPHATLDDDDETLITTGYGYGMFTGIFAGQPAYYHPGDNPGYRSFAGWFPEQAASIVVLANDEGIDAIDLLRELLPAAVDDEEE
jgi:CubicO group peptidase (beta-lactamase class C family)